MQLGHTRLSERAPGEVRYYAWDDALCRSVFPDVHVPVRPPYGEFYLEAMDAHGAWLASPIELVRFASALDGSRKPSLLRPEPIQLIEARPESDSDASPCYYGLGWSIRPVGKGANWWHNGSLPGTIALLVRGQNGWIWAATFNLRPKDDQKFLRETDDAIWKAIESGKKDKRGGTADLEKQF